MSEARLQPNGTVNLSAIRPWDLPVVLPSDKKILEPLLLPSERSAEQDETIKTSRVVIPGSTIKGMVRQNIGAMFGAPMERVKEQVYSYRPNLGLLSGTNRDQHQKAEVLDYCETEGQEKLTVRIPRLDNVTVQVDTTIVRQYLQTMDELLDETVGHKSRNKEFKGNTAQFPFALKKGDEIYVEIQMDQKGDPPKIVSFGRNFRYRWRYADTVRTVQNGSNDENRERSEVKPLDDERVDANGGLLSGARLLFGYVSVEGDPIPLEQAGSAGIGEKNWSRLAGRIAINHALEVSENLSCLKDRFVVRSESDGDSLHDFTIPLNILSSPKASAVEHYLQQPESQTSGPILQTYGDLPGVEPSGVDLNGRKFYRHQPTDENGHRSFEETNIDIIQSNQFTLARFISRAGSKFRFTVRFKDLSLWELGALLVALDPEQMNESPASRDESPRYANKIGHGRPLGLGSVRIHVDRISTLDDKARLVPDQGLQSKAIWAFKEQVETRQLPLAHWLAVLDYSKRRRAEYPNADNKIYTYHTNIRALYSVKRRQQNPDDSEKPKAVPENFGDPVRPDYGESKKG